MTSAVSENFKHSLPTTVCHHFSRLLQCHVYYLNDDNSVRCAFAFGQPSAHSDDKDLFGALFCEESGNGRPVIKTARPGEMYIAINLFEEDKFCGRLAAGPIMDIASPHKDNSPDVFDKTVSAAILLNYFVYGVWIDEKELLKVCIEGRRTLDYGASSRSTIKASQTETIHHHSIVYENHLYSLITEGNQKKLLEMIKTPPDGAYGLLDKEHPLRNLKNDCICTITLAARAAIVGGLDSETAFLLSDEAIQNLELHRDIDGLYRLVEQTLCSFAQMVANTSHLNYSYRTNRCRNYVINHIYEKLTVSEIAAYFGICPEYLSEQFKKETGTRLIDYMQRSRAEEAKKLLLFTDKTILEIASLLNYHDQSHFTKSFKSVFGITPGSCRETGRE